MPTPVSDESRFTDIRCRACGRKIGVGVAVRRSYCDMMCATDYPASSREDRDALVDAIYHEAHPTKVQLAEAFGVSRQMIEQILNNRRIR